MGEGAAAVLPAQVRAITIMIMGEGEGPREGRGRMSPLARSGE